MTKLINWFKNPRNIVFVILMIAVAIYGVIDNNLEIIAGVYVVVFLIGLFIGGIIYLAKRFFK